MAGPLYHFYFNSMRQVFLFSILLYCFVGCDQSFDITIESKPTTFVYSVLDPSDTIHYIRINKSFIADDNIIDIIKISDSLNYSNLKVQIEFFNDIGENVLYYAKPTIYTPKNVGIFYSEPNILYCLKCDINPYTLAEITIINPICCDTISARTKISRPGIFYLPGMWTSSTQVTFYGTGYRMYWQTGTGSYSAISMTFHYKNVYEGFSVNNSFEYLLQYDNRLNLEKEYFFTLDEFLDKVSSRIPIESLVKYRVFDSIDFHINSSEKFLYEYARFFTFPPSEFNLTDLTNVKNGSGIFSSNSRISLTGFSLDVQALDSLVHGQITNTLKFVDY